MADAGRSALQRTDLGMLAHAPTHPTHGSHAPRLTPRDRG